MLELRHRAARLLLLGLLSACAAPPPAPPAPEGAPGDFPFERYTQPGAGERVFVVDTDRSVAKVYARRGGALSRLGHDHVIAARDIQGFARIGNGEVVADLFATLAGMSVDEDELRDEAGFTTQPSADDREGTRRNMLKSLDAAAFPFVRVSLKGRVGDDASFDAGVDAEVTVVLHGSEQRYRLPVAAELSAGALNASGRFEIRQSDYGIAPFSVLGGALGVEDTLEVRFEIAARRSGEG